MNIVFLKELEEKGNWFRIKGSLHNSNWKEGQVEMLWVGRKDVELSYTELRAEGSQVSLTKYQWRTPLDGL